MPRRESAFADMLDTSDDDLGPVGSQKRAAKKPQQQQQYRPVAVKSQSSKDVKMEVKQEMKQEVKEESKTMVKHETIEGDSKAHIKDEIKAETNEGIKKEQGEEASAQTALKMEVKEEDMEKILASPISSQDAFEDVPGFRSADNAGEANTSHETLSPWTFDPPSSPSLKRKRQTIRFILRSPVTKHQDQEQPEVVDDIRRLAYGASEHNSEILKQIYNGTYTHLKDINFPEIYTSVDDKQLAEDILTQYTSNTTFVCPIWANYDKADKLFFDDKRREQCGKLRLPSKVRERIQQFEAQQHPIRHVRLDICTPWNDLAQMKIVFDGTSYIVDFALASDVQSHSVLRTYLRSQAGSMQKELIDEGATYLSLEQLDHLATRFCRKVPAHVQNGVYGMRSTFIQPVEGFREWWDDDERFQHCKKQRTRASALYTGFWTSSAGWD